MKKTTIALGLGLGMTISMGMASQSEAYNNGELRQFEVTASRLNVRADNNTNSAVIGKVTKGSKIFADMQVGNWLRIKVGTGYGWVSADYVRRVDSANTAINTTQKLDESLIKTFDEPSMFETTSNLNFRNTPKKDGTLMGTFKKGTQVKALKSYGNWFFVQNGTQTGWCSGDYLKPADETISNAQKDDIPHFLGLVNTSGGNLNLRADRNQYSRVIVSMPNNSKVAIAYTVGDWVRLTYTDANGKSYTGYAHADYIS